MATATASPCKADLTSSGNINPLKILWYSITEGLDARIAVNFFYIKLLHADYSGMVFALTPNIKISLK